MNCFNTSHEDMCIVNTFWTKNFHVENNEAYDIYEINFLVVCVITVHIYFFLIVMFLGCCTGFPVVNFFNLLLLFVGDMGLFVQF